MTYAVHHNNIMSNKPYSMSFTAGTLLHQESVTIAEAFTKCGDWEQLRDEIKNGNLLQTRTHASSKRLSVEIRARLKLLTALQLELLATGTHHEQVQLLWLAVCKRYRFIYDFAAEVIHEKFLRLDYHLTQDEYEIFFERKAEWHPEVEQVADSTRAKQRQIIFKMMREADLLSSTNYIVPVLLAPAVIEAIHADTDQHFVIYPVSETAVKEWL